MDTNRSNRSGKDRLVVRALVECAGRVLVIKRNKYGDEYMVLPGGGIDPGEDPSKALARELAEETTILAEPLEEVIKIGYNQEKDFPETSIWRCQYNSGVPKLHPDSEEAAENAAGKNTYKPCWVSLEEAIDQVVPLKAREYLRASS